MLKSIKNQKGGQMVEYALLAALVAVAGIASIRTLSDKVANGPIKDVRCALQPGVSDGHQSVDPDCLADDFD